MAAFQQKNQLLFNLEVPSRPMNMAAKFHRPEPIVIEKFGCASPPIITAPKSGLRLSVVSEDNLSMAVQLARRDLKKQRGEELSASLLVTKAKNSKSASAKGKPGVKGHTQVTHSKEYRERLKQKENKAKQALLVKQREKGGKAKVAATQTARSRSSTQGPAQKLKQNIPVRSYSPPVRDTDPDPASLTGDARSMAEIRNLRKEIDQCLLHIRQEQQVAKTNQPCPRPEKRVYAEDVEEERRRALRSEEQAARSARTVYMLTQQVREIQEDLNKHGPNISAAKKTQTLNRLVAAHRGAVRALHTFQQHLSDFTRTSGLPRSYHELGLLLRQLSLCCSQMEVAGETGVPESVLNLLKDYQDMNKALEQDFHSSPKSPPRLCQVDADIRDNKKRSPASRMLDFDAEGPGRPGRQAQTAKKDSVPKRPLLVEKLAPPPIHAAVNQTPDRQAALRAGIAALMRAGESPPPSPGAPRQRSPVPPLNLPASPRTPRGVAWEYPLEKPKLQQWKKTGNKGVLLPAQLQAKRQKVQKVRLPVTEAHYAEPTRSSRLKEVPPEERPVIHSPPRSPSPRRSARSPRATSPRGSSVPGSPRRPVNPTYPGSLGYLRSPRYPGSPGNQRSPRYPGSPGSPDTRDILRMVKEDRESALHQAERARIDKLREDLGHSEQWLDNVESKIREKLEPLLDKAQTGVNADLLTDSLLRDVLEDTARELEDGQLDAEAELEAIKMHDAPSLETMLQRIHDMEEDQQDIRKRWATLVYEDDRVDFPARAKYFDAPLSDQPSSPTPIHLTSELPPPQHTLLPDYVLDRLESQHADNTAIMFTKSQPKPVQHASLHLSQHSSGALHMEPPKVQQKPGIPLSLSTEVLQSIEANKANFEQHLKKMSYQSVGRFNPWQVVEEVSNQIVDDCVADICQELEDINNDIVHLVYSSEFSKVPTPGRENTAPSLHHHIPLPSANGSYLEQPPQQQLDFPSYDRTRALSASSELKSQDLEESKPKSPEPGHSARSRESQNGRHADQENLPGSMHSSEKTMIAEDTGAKDATARAQSPTLVSENYSYEEDFVDSSPRGKTPRDDTVKSDLSGDSWSNN